jgi:putative peptidoglycan lipid II flippase
MALLRNIATVGGWTMGSRLLGLVRDMFVAGAIGTGPVADAFVVAFRFPNMFRRLFAEGAFNAAFVPLFARRLEEQGAPAARALAEQVLSVMILFLLALTALAQLAMPWLMLAIAPGFVDNPVQFDTAVLFTQITFPYLLFMSLAALKGGILNSLHQFGHAAAAPMLLNICAILGLAVVAPVTGMPGHVLVWSITISGILQFLWMAWSCRRAGMALHLPRPRLSPDVKKLLRLMAPGMLGAGVMQINLLIGTMIATLQDQAASYLYYADRVYQLPLSLIGVAIGVVLLPELTRQLRGGRPVQALYTQNRCLELALLFTLPAAAALVVVPLPIVTLLYERGAFGPAASVATAMALGAFSLGLPAYVLIKSLAPGFYAREDTATPFKVAIADVATNVVLSLSLFPWLGFLGIAIATAVAAWVNAGILFFILHRRGHLGLDEQFRRRWPRILGSSLAMGAAVWVLAALLEPLLARGLTGLLLGVGLIVIAGMALYGALALLSGAAAISDLRRLLRRGEAPAPQP